MPRRPASGLGGCAGSGSDDGGSGTSSSSASSTNSDGGSGAAAGGDAAALMPGVGADAGDGPAAAWVYQEEDHEEELWAAAMAAAEAAPSSEGAVEALAAPAPAPASAPVAARAAAAVLPQLPTPPPPLKGRVCIPCRMARVRCSLQVPCERCFRLCVQCKQSVRKPYTRRVDAGGNEEEREGEEADLQQQGQGHGAEEAAAASPGSSCSGGSTAEGHNHNNNSNKRAGRKRRREEGAADAGVAAAAAAAGDIPPQDSTPLLELTIARNDPKAHAAVYLKGFQRLLQEGRLIRDRVLALMRVWRVWSVAAGVDVTWGLLKQLTLALEVNPAELEEKETLRWGLSAEWRVRRAQRQVQSMGRVSKSLEQLHVFKQADDGHKGMFVALFGGPPPKGDAAWSGSDDEGAGICLQACNAPLVRMLQAAAFASQGAMQYKCIQSLNTLGFIAPGDREQYLYRIQELLFTDTRAISDIFKAAYNEGRVRLYIFSARRVQLEGEPDRVCLVHQVEACPASRHVTDMPEALKTRVVKHYKPYQPGLAHPLLRAPEPFEPPALCAGAFPTIATAPCSSASSVGSDSSGCSDASAFKVPALAAIPSLGPAVAVGAAAPSPSSSASSASSPPSAPGPVSAALLVGGFRGFGGGGGSEGALFGARPPAMGSGGTSSSSGRAFSSVGLVKEEAKLADISLPRPSVPLAPHLRSPTPAAAAPAAAAPVALAYPPAPSGAAAAAPVSSSDEAAAAAAVMQGAGATGDGGADKSMPGRGNGLPAVPVFDEAGMDQIFD